MSNHYHHSNTQITFPCPEHTNVPMKATLLGAAVASGGWGKDDLRQGSVSPVKLDSSTDRSTA